MAGKRKGKNFTGSAAAPVSDAVEGLSRPSSPARSLRLASPVSSLVGSAVSIPPMMPEDLPSGEPKLFYDVKLKERLLEEKAATLSTPCTGRQWKCWLESIRTSFGKLVLGGPSGSGEQNYTSKETWIMSKPPAASFS